MRRPVNLAMSAVTVVVAVAALRSGQRAGLDRAVTVAAPAGIVDATDAPTTPASPGRSAAPSSAPSRLLTSAPSMVLPRGGNGRPGPTPPAQSPPSLRQAPTAPRPPQSPNSQPSPTQSAATTTTVNGAAADTQYGPVQVQVSIRGHRIIRADAIDYPQGSSRDRDINSRAIPELDQETLNAQSSNIDTVSGASYTSDGYRQSLQSALDAAHRAGAW